LAGSGLDPASVVLSADYVIRQAKCSGIRLTPASVGDVAVVCRRSKCCRIGASLQ
jgi:hypothetical protein